MQSEQVGPKLAMKAIPETCSPAECYLMLYMPLLVVLLSIQLSDPCPFNVKRSYLIRYASFENFQRQHEPNINGA